MPHYWYIHICVCVRVCVRACVPHVMICKWNLFCTGSFPCEILRFSEWQVSWRLLYSGMWFQVVWLISSEISEKPAASVFYIKDGCRRIFCHILHIYHTAWLWIPEDSNFQNSFPVFNCINCNYYETLWTKSNATCIKLSHQRLLKDIIVLSVSMYPTFQQWGRGRSLKDGKCGSAQSFLLAAYCCILVQPKELFNIKI
jgi:hypothetical protein